MEAYYATFSAAQSLEGPLSRKELAKAAAAHFERAGLLGHVGLPEAANPVSFGNAVDLLLSRAMLEEVREETGAAERREPRYAPGTAFEDLRALTERLAAALSAR